MTKLPQRSFILSTALETCDFCSKSPKRSGWRLSSFCKPKTDSAKSVTGFLLGHFERRLKVLCICLGSQKWDAPVYGHDATSPGLEKLKINGLRGRHTRLFLGVIRFFPPAFARQERARQGVGVTVASPSKFNVIYFPPAKAQIPVVSGHRAECTFKFPQWGVEKVHHCINSHAVKPCCVPQFFIEARTGFLS